jgi:hypothetical protein
MPVFNPELAICNVSHANGCFPIGVIMPERYLLDANASGDHISQPHLDRAHE